MSTYLTRLRFFLFICLESIAILARPVIAAFQSSFNSEEEWGDHQNNIIAPRILQLIEELPALALSGREINLRNRLDLLNGYLLMILNFEKHSNGYLDKHGGNYINLSQGSFIGASLASRDISILIRKSVSGKHAFVYWVGNECRPLLHSSLILTSPPRNVLTCLIFTVILKLDFDTFTSC